MAAWRSYALLYCLLCTAAFFCAPVLSKQNLSEKYFSAKRGDSIFASREMEEIIVTGTNPLPIISMPRSVSVITAEDIERSAARSLPDLLASEANITLRSFSGNEKFSSIDIRGSGATSVSNVLVLIDGVKINAPDLSGPDFSIIALSQIERIEIIRGGNSVRYGSGASHGVINIFTRKTLPGLTGRLRTETGQFGTQASNAVISVASKSHSLALNSAYKKNEGYREHNQLTTKDFMLAYKGIFNPVFSVQLKSNFHRDQYELPGPIARASVDSGMVDRRFGSVEAGAEGETSDSRQLLQFTITPSETLNIQANFQFRERENEFIFGQQFSQISKPARDLIDQRTLYGELITHWSPIGEKLKITTGLEQQTTRYLRTEDILRHAGDLDTQAYFIHTSFKPVRSLTLSVGYRRDKTNNDSREGRLTDNESSPDCDVTILPDIPDIPGFDPVFTNCPSVEVFDPTIKNPWDNEAYEANIVYAIDPSLYLYSSFSKTFRNPNVDELLLSPAQIPNLKNIPELGPQTAKRYELGIKYDGDYAGINLGYFYFDADDEILFALPKDSGFGINFNSPTPIIRQGGEIQALVYLPQNIDLAVNLGYTDARNDDNKRIPLVPYVTASTQINWAINSNFNANLSARYTGERYDGNDFDNTDFDKLGSYVIVNTKVQFKHQINNSVETAWYIGINNLFSKEYSEAAFSNGIYPAPERNIYGGFSLEF